MMMMTIDDDDDDDDDHPLLFLVGKKKKRNKGPEDYLREFFCQPEGLVMRIRCYWLYFKNNSNVSSLLVLIHLFILSGP